MYLAPLQEVNAVNTGVPRPTVPIHRKLGIEHVLSVTITSFHNIQEDAA